MVVAVQELGGDPRVVGEPLGREEKQATAPREQETLAGERVQDTGVAEACGVAHRHDHRTNVEVVAVCLRQGGSILPRLVGAGRRRPAPAPGLGAA
jgi:hypothetical protein